MPFDEVTAEIVARAGGVSKGLVFHYFPTTRDLQVAVLRAATAELLADLDVGEGLPPDERLRVGLDAFMRYIEQQPASYQAVVRRAGSDERLLEVFEDTRTAVVGIVAATLGLSELPPGLRLAIRGWIAMVEECVLHWLVRSARPPGGAGGVPPPGRPHHAPRRDPPWGGGHLPDAPLGSEASAPPGAVPRG